MSTSKKDEDQSPTGHYTLLRERHQASLLLVEGISVPPAYNEQPRGPQRTHRKVLLRLFAVIAGLAVAAVAFFGSNGRSSLPQQQNALTRSSDVIMPIRSTEQVEAESAVAATTLDTTASFLRSLPDYTLSALNEPSSPQYKAFQWVTTASPSMLNLSLDRMIQRFALATLYYATGGGGDDNSGNSNSWKRMRVRWLDEPINTHECEWYHIECSRNNNNNNNTSIRAIHLYLNNLVGTIPREISLLTKLEVLRLSNNALFGTIPTEMGLLTNLRSLYLSQNSLSGTIPTQLGLLRSHLDELYLWGNALAGTIPTQLGGLLPMTSLYLSQNQLVGTIPTELGRLTNLKWLNLDRNALTGTLPTELGQLLILPMSSNDRNSKSDVLPSFRYSWMDLSNNQLSGSVPIELCRKLLDHPGKKHSSRQGGNNTEQVLTIDCQHVGCECGCACG